MPEGPSIVILRELVEALHLEGSTLIDVVGTTELDKDRMINQKVIVFKTWGKHFLICFEDFALRIHLMMFGSYRINDRKESKPKIGLVFKTAELNFYTCELKYIEGDLTEVYDWTADIMSDAYDIDKTVKRLKEHSESFVCDLLLDQSVFAGSGNIIKNEVLYRIRIQPLTKIADLSTVKLKSLAIATQQYAFDFLKWKKENTLKRHWGVYGKKTCPKDHAITKKNLGKNKRVSFYCPVCQKLIE